MTLKRPAMRSEAPPEVPDRGHRVATRQANRYLVEEDGEFTLVDASYAGH